MVVEILYSQSQIFLRHIKSEVVKIFQITLHCQNYLKYCRTSVKLLFVETNH